MVVQGKVYDKATGQGLPNAAVYFSGSDGNYIAGNAATTTDSEGEFELVGIESAYVTASYTGYNKNIKRLSGAIDFAMTGNSSLPEVNITGTLLWPRIAVAVVVIAVTLWIFKPWQ